MKEYVRHPTRNEGSASSSIRANYNTYEAAHSMHPFHSRLHRLLLFWASLLGFDALSWQEATHPVAAEHAEILRLSSAKSKIHCLCLLTLRRSYDAIFGLVLRHFATCLP